MRWRNMEFLFLPNNYDKYFGCWCRREPLWHNLVLEKLFPDVSLDKKREKLFVSIGNTLSDMHSRWRMITSTAFRENYQTTVCLRWGLFLRKSEHNPGAVFNLVLAWGSYSELRETLWFYRIIKPLNVKDKDIKRLKAKTSQFVSE